MAPKSAESAIAEATKDTAFLAACFMNLKEKPQVDSAAVAAQLTMSAGGVRNKLRPIIKAMEDAGALWTTNQSPVPNRARAAKSTSTTAGTVAKNAVDAEKVDGAEHVTPKPKAKAQAKSRNAVASSSTKRGRKAKESDTDDDEIGKTTAPSKKKAKTTPATVADEQNQFNGQIKTEHSLSNSANGKLEAEDG